MKKKFVVEARFEDGTLNVKAPTVPEGSRLPVDGATEDQLFDFFFKKNPNYRTASWHDLVEFYDSLGGYVIREKTW